MFDAGGTRTHSLLIRSQAPYPLGHGADLQCVFMKLYHNNNTRCDRTINILIQFVDVRQHPSNTSVGRCDVYYARRRWGVILIDICEYSNVWTSKRMSFECEYITGCINFLYIYIYVWVCCVYTVVICSVATVVMHCERPFCIGISMLLIIPT